MSIASVDLLSRWTLAAVLFAQLSRSPTGGLLCKQPSKGNRIHSPFQKHSLSPPPACPQFVPSPVLHLPSHQSSDRQWCRLSAELTVYCSFKVPAGKQGSHLFVSLTPPSQWVRLTMGHSPLPLISLPSWEE